MAEAEGHIEVVEAGDMEVDTVVVGAGFEVEVEGQLEQDYQDLEEYHLGFHLLKDDYSYLFLGIHLVFDSDYYYYY